MVLFISGELMANGYTNLTELRTRHQEILRRHIKGERNIDIAQALKMDQGTVCQIINSPIGQSEIARITGKLEDGLVENLTQPLESTADEILAGATAQAANVMVNLMTTGGEKVALQAAKDILDRRGIGQRSSGAGVSSITLQVDQSTNILQTLAEVGIDARELLSSVGVQTRQTPRALDAKSLLPS